MDESLNTCTRGSQGYDIWSDSGGVPVCSSNVRLAYTLSLEHFDIERQQREDDSVGILVPKWLFNQVSPLFTFRLSITHVHWVLKSGN